VLYAWGAGAAFAASLGYFVYTYAYTLARPVAVSGRDYGAAGAAAADTLLFAAFALHHSLFARTAVKRWLTRRVPAPLERATFVWVASLLLSVVCAAWQPVGGTLYRRAGAAALPHWAIVGLGFVLTAAAARRLRPLELAGVEQALHRVRGRHEEQLVHAWPYSLVRHPIYLGWVLVVFGVPHMTGSRLLLAALSTVYLVAAIPLEERQLERGFGEGYREYRRQIRWRMVPGVY
jgi:protein-S-isoprenylcysteine O-methyltransferase Ste14